MEALARELAKQHTVTVVTAGTRDTAGSVIEGGVRVIRARVLGRNEREVASFISMASYLPAGFVKALMFCGIRDIDVINTHFVVPTGPLGFLLSRIYRRPNVLTLHGGDIYDPSKKFSPHRLPLLRPVIRSLLRGASRVVAQSSDTKARAESYFHCDRHIDVIPLGIEEPTHLIRVPKGNSCHFNVVTVGRLVPRKRVDLLITAFAHASIPLSILTIVGNGPLLGDLKSLARNLQVSDKVRFIEDACDEEKYRILASADLFASASSHEGFGLVFLEAMYCGLPVISYGVGGQRDFLENNRTGVIVESDDAKDFSEALKQFAHSRDLVQRVGEYNSNKVRRFFIRECAKHYEKLFEEEVIKSKGIYS